MANVFTLLRSPWATHWRVLAVLLLYASYLPLSGYTVGQVQFDAAHYWELSLKFTQHGHISLLDFDAPLRGYLGPLLILPARLLCHFTGWSMLTGAQVLGAAWAALLFGVAIPQLWAQVTGRCLSGGRWLVLLLLGFAFWRDYFNFTLSDMPALALLLLGLGALHRPGWAWAGAAGVLLAAALNIRPIYVASIPAALWLIYSTHLSMTGRSMRTAALCAGAALVLWPQWLINQQYFQESTPLVLAQRTDGGSLYLKQLSWGTRFQRYETSLIPAFPRSLVYADPAGQQALAAEPNQRFTSYGQYLQFLGRRPLASVGRYARHLFNGLDIRYATPYPTQLHPPGQALVQLLNYALMGWGVVLAGTWLWPRRRLVPVSRKSTAAPVLLALVLPCLLVLPTLMECRFLLPLHLLLLTTVAAVGHPARWWQTARSVRRLTGLLVLLGWLWGCWHLSEATARHLRPPSEAPQD